MCNKMSDVRLSNASPTLERVDARQPDHTKPPVCRNLFGTFDREEFQRDRKDIMREEQRAFAERWSFDPVLDRPLSPGDCKWESVTCAPEFYYRPPHQRQPPRQNADLSGGGDDRRDAERGADLDPVSNGSRKRTARGGCSSECQSKRSHTDEEDDDDDDDDDQSDGAVSQTATRVERTPSKPDSGTLLY
ncbi:cyclin-dependent kinase inhibitor 1Ba [Polymixia lowei]